MLVMFSFPLCAVARSTCALRLRGFIASRLSTVVGSLMVTTTSRCVCMGATSGTCVFAVPASVAPLAASAASLTAPPVCSPALFICLTIYRVALPTSIASLAAFLAFSPSFMFCCTFVATAWTVSVVFLISVSSSCLTASSIRAALSVVVLASVCMMLSVSHTVLRSGACCTFSMNVSVPWMMTLTSLPLRAGC
jgi:hypothetical protein